MTRNEMVNQFSTKQLLELYNDQSLKIVDVRPVDSYNGWRQQNEVRGGHIKGMLLHTVLFI